MLSDDIEIVDRAIDHLCRGQDTVDAWLRIKAALVESTNSSHNKQSAPCFSCAKWGGCWRGINAVSPKCFVSK